MAEQAHDDRCERIEIRVARLEEQLKSLAAATAKAEIHQAHLNIEFNNVRLRFLDKEDYRREHRELQLRDDEKASLVDYKALMSRVEKIETSRSTIQIVTLLIALLSMVAVLADIFRH